MRKRETGEHDMAREGNPGDMEIRMHDYWKVIKRYKFMIAVVVCIATVSAVIVSLMMPKYYRSDATILPMGGGGGGGLASLASQLGNLPFLAGIGGGGQSTPQQQLLALLNSRTLAEQIVNKYSLVNLLFEDKWDKEKGQWKEGAEIPTERDAAEELRGLVTFSNDMQLGTITVVAEARSPKLAADLANWYVDGLREFMNQNSFTVEKKNRLFIEGQLAENKRVLLETGKQINEFYKGGRVSNVKSSVDVVASAVDDFNFGTDGIELPSLGYKEASWEIIESEKGILREKLNNIAIVKDVPQQIYLQYLSLRRGILGKINALLASQYEMAKIEEAKEDLAFQVVDSALPPLLRFKPQRKKIVMMAFVGSLLLGIFLSFVIEYIKKLRKQFAQ